MGTRLLGSQSGLIGCWSQSQRAAGSIVSSDMPATPLACGYGHFRVLQPSQLTSQRSRVRRLSTHVAVRATPVAYAGIRIRAQQPGQYERPSTRQHTQPTTYGHDGPSNAYKRSGPLRADQLRLHRLRRASHRAMHDLSVTR